MYRAFYVRRRSKEHGSDNVVFFLTPPVHFATIRFARLHLGLILRMKRSLDYDRDCATDYC